MPNSTPSSRPDLRKFFHSFIREHYGFVVKAFGLQDRDRKLMLPALRCRFGLPHN